MKTAKEREADFLRDLDALLKKHGAEILVTDDGKAYGMHSGIAEVTMDSEWDADGNQLAEYTAFTLPGFITADNSSTIPAKTAVDCPERLHSAAPKGSE